MVLVPLGDNNRGFSSNLRLTIVPRDINGWCVEQRKTALDLTLEELLIAGTLIFYYFAGCIVTELGKHMSAHKFTRRYYITCGSQTNNITIIMHAVLLLVYRL